MSRHLIALPLLILGLSACPETEETPDMSAPIPDMTTPDISMCVPEIQDETCADDDGLPKCGVQQDRCGGDVDCGPCLMVSLPDETIMLEAGQTARPIAKIEDDAGMPYNTCPEEGGLVWSLDPSPNPNAAISADGNLTAITPGELSVRVRCGMAEASAPVVITLPIPTGSTDWRPAAWYDAESATADELRQGTSVLSWTDKGAEPRDNLQSAIALRTDDPLNFGPTYLAGVLNNRPVLQFNQGFPDPFNADSYQGFLLRNADQESATLALTKSTMIIVAKTTDATASGTMLGHCPRDGFGNTFGLRLGDGPHLRVFADGADPGQGNVMRPMDISTELQDMSTSQFHIYSIVRGDTLTMYQDGALQGLCDEAAANCDTPAESILLGFYQAPLAFDRIGIGCGVAEKPFEPGVMVPADAFVGEIAEVMIYDQDLLPEDRRKIETYLSTKFALPLK